MPIVRRSRADIDIQKLKIDWKEVDKTTDADIAAQIAADPDTAPAWTAADVARARPVQPWPTPDDIRAIRKQRGLSQEAFAARYGFSVETIRNYEQGHRQPTGPTRVLLRVIAAEPEAVERALARTSTTNPSTTNVKSEFISSQNTQTLSNDNYLSSQTNTMRSLQTNTTRMDMEIMPGNFQSPVKNHPKIQAGYVQ